MYVQISVCVYVYIYIYIYTQRVYDIPCPGRPEASRVDEPKPWNSRRLCLVLFVGVFDVIVRFKQQYRLHFVFVFVFCCFCHGLIYLLSPGIRDS